MSGNEKDKIKVLGVGFDNLTMDEAVVTALSLIASRSGGYVVTPNPEIVWMCRRDAKLRAAADGALLTLADGIGIIYGARLLGAPLRQKLPGIDFAAGLMSRLAQIGGSVYLLGARPGVAERAGKELEGRYPGLIVSGARDGFFSDDADIITDINQKKPDLLMVCLGAPKQELWMEKNRGALEVGLMAGLGGSLDVFSGEVRRAPPVWRGLGLEWLYRLLKEPRRIGRMMTIPLFLLAVIFERNQK